MAVERGLDLSKMFAKMKQKAHDAAEEAAGVDLDGDGKIGSRPVAAKPAAPAPAATSAARAGGAPPPAAHPAPTPTTGAGGLFGKVEGVLGDQLRASLGGANSKGKPAAGSGGFTSLLGNFNKLDPKTQAAAEHQSRDLDSGIDLPLSTCTGRKRALLIGINYVGSASQLRGCINDVKNIRQFIVDKFRFPTDADSMRVLTDDGAGHGQPTRANIIAGMKWLIEGAKSGDSLFIHYSGHGATSKDVSPNTDEADAQDETLVPVDYQTAGMIVDDDIFDMMVAPLPQGVRLTAIMDCCHSGSVFDLPYSYVLENGRDVATEVDNRKMAMAAAMAAGKAWMAGDKAGALKGFMEAGKYGLAAYMEMKAGGGGAGAPAEAASSSYPSYPPAEETAASSSAAEPTFQVPETTPAPSYSEPTPSYAAPSAAPTSSFTGDANLLSQGVAADAIKIRTALADVIQFSGCRDEQTSADAFIAGQSAGAMSFAFISAFQNHGMNQTYSELLRNIRTILQGKYQQIPQMSVGHKMKSMDIQFLM